MNDDKKLSMQKNFHNRYATRTKEKEISCWKTKTANKRLKNEEVTRTTLKRRWIVDRQQISNFNEEQESWYLKTLDKWCYYDEIITTDVADAAINC